MKLDERIAQQLKLAEHMPLPATLQGVSKERIRQVLTTLDRNQPDAVDAVFALLDDQTGNYFSGAGAFRFWNGASTAHIACHIGIIQRGKGKLDREGRDYWLKPLWEIGALEKVYFAGGATGFIPGHPKAKSPNSAYRIAPSFAAILRAPEQAWRKLLEAWSSGDALRARLRLQAEAAAAAKETVDSEHEALIADIQKFYVPVFLPGYEVLYVDVGDGDRITAEDRARLAAAGIMLQLDDPMPDILLWNRTQDSLWIIEAVCSDGEVDTNKVNSLIGLKDRFNKRNIGFTTAYRTWREAARRQAGQKNLPPNTCIWIQEDGAKQFVVSTPPTT